MASSIASSSSFVSQFKSRRFPVYEKEEEFDVFVCFTGKTRGGFTSHLVKELKHAGIRVFTDELLPRGEAISDALLDHIKASKSTIIVVSKDFAASTWCLDEVVGSFRSKEEKQGQHLIFPIFYKVDPSEIRHLRGTTGHYLYRHQERYGRNSDKVSGWRTGLVLLSNTAGWHHTTGGNESALIQKIVKEVVTTLRRNNMKHSYCDNLLHACRESIVSLLCSLYLCFVSWINRAQVKKLVYVLKPRL